nr:hypothetical protein [Paenibacillus pasadenensis]
MGHQMGRHHSLIARELKRGHDESGV